MYSLKINRAGIFIPLVLLVLTAITSCRHKELLYPDPEEVKVVFEWDNASGADVDGMALFFYPLDGHSRIWRFDIAGRDGGAVTLPCGTYELIACNNDLPGITLEDTQSPATILASARRPASGKETGVYAGTGMLYRGEINRLEVTPCGVRYISATGVFKDCAYRTVRCRPDSMSTVYTVNFTNVSGIERMRSAFVALEGVSPSILLESGRPSDISAALAIDMVPAPDGASISGGGCAFAPVDLATAGFGLRLQIMLANGKTLARDIELKPENLNIISRHNVLITVDGLSIPDDGSSGDIGDMDVIVDGWEVIEIDLQSRF